MGGGGQGGGGKPNLVKAPSESRSHSHTGSNYSAGGGGAGGGGGLVVSGGSGAVQLLSPKKASQGGQFKNTKGKYCDFAKKKIKIDCVCVCFDTFFSKKK